MFNEMETKMYGLAQAAVAAAIGGKSARVRRAPPGSVRPMTSRDGIETLELIALHTDQALLRGHALAALSAASTADHPRARRVAGAARAALKRLPPRT